MVTGSRAEYGLLYWLLKEIQADLDLELQLAVTGMHLSPEFGLTYKQIEADGLRIDARIEMLLSSDTPAGVTKSMGLGTIGFADAFERLQPDIVVLLGDRFEILAAAQAALVARIPIAHIHGGETSEGAMDESIRHAISKIAQWHIVAAEPYRKRLIQMGEAPERVFNFGAPGLDHLNRMTWLTRAELEESLEIQLKKPLFLITYHPVTLPDSPPESAMRELLAALEQFPGATMIFTYPNADTGGRILIECLDHFVAKHPDNTKAFASLGQQRYLSLMREADIVIGNSSSGLIEAPAVKKATVNIGDRQKGRLKATSVIDAAEECSAIAYAVNRALSDEFRASLPYTPSIYGQGNVSGQIRLLLKSPLPDVRKSFFDIEHAF